ncbi:MAG TPA: Gfo/Idh/MocA family oxidoreductase [Ignavibacteria bacterium]|nr:Gfo/Idh/MocA family oxidoreductase [Ignavibacteria bacterium]
MKEVTKFAVVGLGGIAQLIHLPILSKLKDVEIVSLAEINKNRLNTVSEKFGIKNTFTDYKELIEKSEFDAAIIATPTNTHHDIAIDFLKAGKDLLIEKPIALNYEEARRINDTAKKYSCKVMVGMNLRFRPDAMLLKSIINSGELGDIFYIKCGWLRKQSSEQKWFFKKNEAGGGVILDLGINLLDLSLWLIDFPGIQSVSVQNFHHNTKNVEDSAVGFIRSKNGTVINFDVSWSLHSESDGFNLTAFGSEGTAHLNPLNAYRRIDSIQIDLTTPSSGKKDLFKKSYENELKHFIGAINGINPILSSSDDALKRMKLVEVLYKSAQQNKEIKI